MIVCPRCSSALRDAVTSLSCDACGYQAERRDGVILFEPDIAEEHEDYKAEGLDALYGYEQRHPWFTHRVNVIRKAFARHVEKQEKIVEIGAGTGHTARALLEDGYANFAVGEIHRNGLLYAARYGLTRLFQFDLRHAPFRDEFDVVALFDVIEHIDDDALAVRNVHAMLRPGGRVVLSVPAHPWLWSRIDELSSHRRRYTRKSMGALLRGEGLDVVESRYFFTALVPALLLRRFLSRNTTEANVAEGCGLEVSRSTRLAFALAARAGDVLLYPLRALTGGSLLVVARKR